jgi:hypothetical protein
MARNENGKRRCGRKRSNETKRKGMKTHGRNGRYK